MQICEHGALQNRKEDVKTDLDMKKLTQIMKQIVYCFTINDWSLNA